MGNYTVQKVTVSTRVIQNIYKTTSAKHEWYCKHFALFFIDTFRTIITFFIIHFGTLRENSRENYHFTIKNYTVVTLQQFSINQNLEK